MLLHFHSPQFFILLIFLPLIYYFGRRKKRSALRFSDLQEIKKIHGGQIFPVRMLQLLLRSAAFVLFIVALARPQTVEAEREFETKGIDIVISMDISGSMLAEDFKPTNRMEVAKREAENFIRGRKNDRIGLVVFARKSYTQSPMTLDYDVLIELLRSVEIGLIKDGTAIGLGLANAVNRLRDSDAKTKIVILLTDGDNNAGNIDPVTAAELAKSFGIKVYTICIGKKGLVPFPIEDPVFGKRYVQAQVDVDETVLKRIADITGGLFFQATDSEALHKIYQQIDKLEKNKIKVKEYTSYKELYHLFLIPGMLLLLAELLITNVFFVKIP